MEGRRMEYGEVVVSRTKCTFVFEWRKFTSVFLTVDRGVGGPGAVLDWAT